MIPLVIRPMTPADQEPVVAIIHAHEPFDGVCSKRYYAEYFARSEAGTAPNERNYVAVRESDNRLLGVCGYSPDHYQTPGIAWINWFYVDESARGTGAGRALFAHVMEELRGLNMRRVLLDTSDDEIYERAVDFYRQQGFQLEGTLPDYYGKGEAYVIYGLTLRREGD